MIKIDYTATFAHMISLRPTDDIASCSAQTMIAKHADQAFVFSANEKSHRVISDGYLDLLLAGQRQEACYLITEAVKAGMPLVDAYVKVLQPALYKLGLLWEQNRATVMQEQYCIAATQGLLGELAPDVMARGRLAGNRREVFVGACVPGESHELGLRFVAIVLEISGWDTWCLGTGCPIGDVIDLGIQKRPLAIGLSMAIDSHLDQLKDAIAAIRACRELTGVAIIVGGLEVSRIREVGDHPLGRTLASANAADTR